MRELFLTALLVLGACGPLGGAQSSQRPAAVPENAIEVGIDYYMVPLDERVQGCPAYRPFSPTLRVQQAIHYRTADGRFVRDRSQAVCD